MDECRTSGKTEPARVLCKDSQETFAPFSFAMPPLPSGVAGLSSGRGVLLLDLAPEASLYWFENLLRISSNSGVPAIDEWNGPPAKRSSRTTSSLNGVSPYPIGESSGGFAQGVCRHGLRRRHMAPIACQATFPDTKMQSRMVRGPKPRLEPSRISDSAFIGTMRSRNRREVMGNLRKVATNMTARR